MKENHLWFWLQKLDGPPGAQEPSGDTVLALKKLSVGKGNDLSKVTQTDDGGRHGVGTRSFDSSPASLPIF